MEKETEQEKRIMILNSDIKNLESVIGYKRATYKPIYEDRKKLEELKSELIRLLPKKEIEVLRV